jgi:hypothetical protein
MVCSTSALRTYQGPVAVHSVEISVADTRVLDVDKNLIRAWLLHWNLLVLDGSTSLLNDLRPLLGRNGTHVDVSKLLNMLFVFTEPSECIDSSRMMLKCLS